MASVVVSAQVYSSSVGLADTMANLARRIEAKGGYKAVAESVGSDFGLIPRFGNVHFTIYGVPNDPKEADRAKSIVAGETGIYTFGAQTLRNLAAAFYEDVVIKSVEETKEVIQSGAGGFGFGLGFGLILVGAAYILVLRGGKA